MFFSFCLFLFFTFDKLLNMWSNSRRIRQKAGFMRRLSYTSDEHISHQLCSMLGLGCYKTGTSFSFTTDFPPVWLSSSIRGLICINVFASLINKKIKKSMSTQSHTQREPCPLHPNRATPRLWSHTVAFSLSRLSIPRGLSNSGKTQAASLAQSIPQSATTLCHSSPWITNG